MRPHDEQPAAVPVPIPAVPNPGLAPGVIDFSDPNTVYGIAVMERMEGFAVASVGGRRRHSRYRRTPEYFISNDLRLQLRRPRDRGWNESSFPGAEAGADHSGGGGSGPAARCGRFPSARSSKPNAELITDRKADADLYLVNGDFCDPPARGDGSLKDFRYSRFWILDSVWPRHRGLRT